MDIYATGYLADKKKELKYAGYKNYRSAVNNYIIPFFKNKDLRKFTAKDFRKFKEYLEERLTLPGVRTKMAVLKNMFRTAYSDEDISRLPPFPSIEVDDGDIVEYLTLQQQDKILAEIPERHRSVFAFGMEFGLRCQEVIALQKDCVVDGEVCIRRKFEGPTFVESTKTGSKGSRTMAITSYAQELLDNLPLNVSPFVFVRDDGKPYTNYGLNRIWHKAEKKVGFTIKLYNAMRHSLGCQLLDQGETIETVRQIYGHTNVNMTMRYTRRRITPAANNALERRRGGRVVYFQQSGNGAEIEKGSSK